MFGLTVRDHMMIAHSFNGEIFGPAQKLHGATYVVDVTFERHQLDEDDLIVDIGLASELLKDVLSEFNMKNLDELPELAGRNTTTEFMAGMVFQRMADAIKAGRLGESARVMQPGGSQRQAVLVAAICVVASAHARSSLSGEICCPGVDMRRPERHALGNLRDHLSIVRLTFLEAQLQADLVVHCTALAQRLE